MTRLLTIMGSGETSPTMVRTHRDLLSRLGPPPVPAVLLDTPFGFQANAAELTARAVEYFRASVGHDIAAASLRDAGVPPAAREAALGRIREARYVFAGPGSPSYALRQWRGTPVPALLAEKLEQGGAVTFASAAALTLGVVTVPVYEIYKVGDDPHWLEGLDLLALTGVRAAVIPHYDNAEGGTHDTRFCYLGEARLERLERQLPEDAFVLGVDEHTGVVFDLDAGTATVVGLGSLTVRRAGRSVAFPSGTCVPSATLASTAAGAGPLPPEPAPEPPVRGAPGGPVPASPLLAETGDADRCFSAALAGGDVGAAVNVLLELEDTLVSWSRDSLQSDEMDRARSVLRSMVVRLAEVATGARDRAEVVAPFVDALVDLRAAARRAGRYDEADEVRDRLIALGVEVRDGRSRSSWSLLS